MRKKSTKLKSNLSLTTFFSWGGGGGCEVPFQFWHLLQWLTMPTNVPTNRKIDNLKNAEIWPIKFLMFWSKIVYLSCLSSDFNDLGIKIQEILEIKQ